ncbi:MAG TPA: oxidoreductase-like domain-containing protein [Telluria sp.]
MRKPAHRDDPKPIEPVAPALEDCCRSGCTPCVFDLYEEAMDRYRSALANWEARRHAVKASAPRPSTSKASDDGSGTSAAVANLPLK